VSHQPERTEKNCLNCGTLVAGRYCQHCGQENVVTKQSAGAFVKHFVYDIFHFDGKFFDTMKQLLFRPGYVPKLYVEGKRISHLDPIRMYLFTSAVFFLVVFTAKGLVRIENSGPTTRSMTQNERLKYASQLYNENPDSTGRKQLSLLLDTTYRVIIMEPTGRTKNDSSFQIEMEGHQYAMVAEKKDTSGLASTGSSWLDKRIRKAGLGGESEDSEAGQEKVKHFVETFVHKMPYLLFVSLPFFALILKLLYRRNKSFYYSDHAVFTLYHYIFSFILLLLFYGVNGLEKSVGWKIFAYLLPVIFVWGGIYLYISMLKFYGQRKGKTLGKFVLLNILGFFMLMFLFLIFIIFSILQS